MINGQTLDEFLYDPDTVDFISKDTEYYSEYIKNNPNILLTQKLEGKYIIGYVNRYNIPKIMSQFGTNFAISNFFNSVPLVLGLLDRANLEAAGIIQAQEQPFLQLRGSGVLIGIIDTGIDYTNKTFIYEDGTSKIRYLFDQTMQGDRPPEYYIGAEYTNEQINEALKSENPYDIVPQRDTVGHGTFLASLAAGREVGDYIGAAPDSELIVVKLKNARQYYREKYLVPDDQENAYESSAIMVGIDYVIKKAEELRRPVAICLALGTNQGSHDGFSLFEEYISSICKRHALCPGTAG